MTARRISPVAFSLTLAVVGLVQVGTAQASATRNQKPNGQIEASHESPMKSAYRAIQKGVKKRNLGAALWEYSDRRQVSGPSWIARQMTAIGNGIRKAGKAIASIGAEGRERRAAARDFNAWTKEAGNEDARTFYRGARAERGIRTSKVMRVVNIVGGTGLAALGVATGNAPAMIVGGGTAGAMIALGGKMIRTEERAARDRTLSKQLAVVSPVRLARWQKAGIIGAEAAETAVQLGINEQ